MKSDPDDLIALPDLPRELTELTGESPPNNRKCYAKIVDGLLPAEKKNGRWYTRRRDLPEIAKLLA